MNKIGATWSRTINDSSRVRRNKSGELWSTNKKVIGAHVDPPNWTFSGDYISTLRGRFPLKFLHTHNSLNCICSWPWGAGRPHVGLCPIFLVYFYLARCSIFRQRFGTLRPKQCKHVLDFSWNPSWNLLEICWKFVQLNLSKPWNLGWIFLNIKSKLRDERQSARGC